MKQEKANKIKLVKIWEILSQETDENNPMGTQTLIKKLKEIGIDCTRKTLYADIDTLNAFGYEILCTRGVSNLYYVVDRKFDMPELRILIDAVQAASFITPKKTKEFVDKIAHLSGSRSAEVLKSNVVEFNTAKSKNESIYYAVNEIALAIRHGKQVEFLYFDMDVNKKRVYRKEGAKYTVSPYATIFSNDRYYLLCYDDKHKNMSHYRIDRMSNVSMIDKPVNSIVYTKPFDVKKHKGQVFDMFTGRPEKVRFLADNSLIDVVVDKFGEQVKLYSAGENSFSFTADVQVSKTFLAWCCGFGKSLKVTSPASVINELKEYTKELFEHYN